MKRIGILLILAHVGMLTYSQATWTWLKGTNRTPKYGIYGTRGVADTANIPGFRTGESTWTDSVGNVWMFGGRGNARNGTGYLNDLWKWTKATGTWTWVSGDQDFNQFGRYGTKGVASPLNMIRCRAYANTWMDKQGNLWLHGGEGYDNFTVNTPAINLSDFWKFDIKNALWTWMGGDTSYKFRVVYPSVWGKKGIPSAATYPASRLEAATWTDDNNNLWLFGGFSLATAERSLGNGLWSYSISSGLWTWMGGDTTSNQAGNYGVKGVAAATNLPPALSSATFWKDKNGDFFLFGGLNPSPFKPYNDIWKYSPTTDLWTWLEGQKPESYGIQGQPAALNQPASRFRSVHWVDSADNVWIYGGRGTGYYNDVWKFNLSAGLWTWMTGPQGMATLSPNFGTGNQPALTNLPGSGDNFSSWNDGDTFKLLSSNLIWDFNPATLQWTWQGGDTSRTNVPPVRKGIFGQKGVAAAANIPEARSFANTWTDALNNLYLFSGTAYFNNQPLSDFWKFVPSLNEWTWIGGDSSGVRPINYGTQGVESDANFPGAGQRATWIDQTGNLWMIGGAGTELWRYNISSGRWAWMGGNPSTTPNYGTIGIPSPTNSPGGFYYGFSWAENKGSVWFFGGETALAYSNQIWRYDTTSRLWTWMYGQQNAFNTNPRFGKKGEPFATINGRSGTTSWVDTAGNFWLFGGRSYAASTSSTRENNNDLWKFSPVTKNWIWVAGDEKGGRKGVYGIKGVPGENNNPGARRDAKGWTDGKNNLYLFGGNFDTSGFIDDPFYTFNDVWKFSISDNRWTWIGGDSTLNHWGMYGTQGQPSADNQPGGRERSATWSNNQGQFWIFSGYGFADNGRRALDDMMMFSPTAGAALPVEFKTFNAYKQKQTVVLEWSTAQEFNSRSFLIERSADGRNYFQIGTIAAAGNSTTPTAYSFTDFSPSAGNNYYRLKEIDLDNRFMFSDVRVVNFSEQKSGFTILGNPVKEQLKLGLDLAIAQRVTVSIRNPAGQFIKEIKYNAAKGNSNIQLSVSNLKRGLYVVIISAETINESKTFMVK
jgi:hypothetical protein